MQGKRNRRIINQLCEICERGNSFKGRVLERKKMVQVHSDFKITAIRANQDLS